MATQPWIRQALESHHVPFQELHHGPALTAQQLAEMEHVSGHQVAKIVVVMSEGRAVQAILPASRAVDLKALAESLGTKACRLASEQEIGALFGDCELGAMPPMRRWPGVEIIMDDSLRTSGDIVF